jgi:anti-sigma28 factor (negative regulator of flagellin synthesis)
MDKFQGFSESSKIWIYQAERRLTEAEVSKISDLLSEFTRTWTAHDLALKADFDIVLSRFIVLCADESRHAASGCSIDKSVNFLRRVESEFGISLFDRSLICFSDENGNLFEKKLNEIKQAIAAGEISSDTLVFDNSLSDLQSFRSRWRTNAGKTWLKRYFA